MRRSIRVASLVVVATLLVGTMFVGGATATTTKLRTNMTGEKEVPGPGDDNGRGRAVIWVNPDEQKVCFTLSWSAIGAPFAAHIHRGEPGVAGPVKVTLFASSEQLPSTIHEVSGCALHVDEDLAHRIAKHPELFYVNVHNPRFPDGAIRGQLHSA
jgi:hypothetical protein